MTGLRSSSRSSGTTSTSADTRWMTRSSAARSAGGRAAVAGEERPRAQAIDHLVRVEVGDRRQPERDVAQQLDQHAAQAADHERPEGRVADDADQRLEPPLDLALQQHAVERVPAAARRSRSVATAVAHLVRRLEAEDDAADVALVHEAGRDRLGDQRDSRAPRRRAAASSGAHAAAAATAMPAARSSASTSCGSSQRAVGAGQRALDDRARRARAPRVEAQRGPARAVAPAAVAHRRRQRARRVLGEAVGRQGAARPGGQRRRRALATTGRPSAPASRAGTVAAPRARSPPAISSRVVTSGGT